jgi:hypothetical protein
MPNAYRSKKRYRRSLRYKANSRNPATGSNAIPLGATLGSQPKSTTRNRRNKFEGKVVKRKFGIGHRCQVDEQKEVLLRTSGDEWIERLHQRLRLERFGITPQLGPQMKKMDQLQARALEGVSTDDVFSKDSFPVDKRLDWLCPVCSCLGCPGSIVPSFCV